MESTNPLLFLGIFILMGHLLQVFFRKTLIPDVLWIMIIGALLGPLGLGKLSSDDFGLFGPLFSSMALVVLLFDGGSHLNLKELVEHGWSLLGITLLTLLGTMCIIFGVVWFFVADVQTSLVAAAILSATSAVVVVPFVKGLPVQKATQTLLLAEAVIADVLCIVISFSLFDMVASGDLNFVVAFKKLLMSVSGASVLGIIGGFLWTILIMKFSSLVGVLSLTMAILFILFGISEQFHWAGPLAALCFGFVLNNRSKMPWLSSQLGVSSLEEYTQMSFQRTADAILEEAIFLLKLFFFLYLGLQLRLDNPEVLLAGAIIAIGMYVLRVIVTRFALAKSFSTFDASVISVMIPKGLVSAVLATQALPLLGLTGHWVEELVFTVVFMTIAISSVIVPLLNSQFGRVLGTRIFSSFPPPVAEEKSGEDPTVSKQ